MNFNCQTCNKQFQFKNSLHKHLRGSKECRIMRLENDLQEKEAIITSKDNTIIDMATEINSLKKQVYELTKELDDMNYLIKLKENKFLEEKNIIEQKNNERFMNQMTTFFEKHITHQVNTQIINTNNNIFMQPVGFFGVEPELQEEDCEENTEIILNNRPEIWFSELFEKYYCKIPPNIKINDYSRDKFEAYTGGGIDGWESITYSDIMNITREPIQSIAEKSINRVRILQERKLCNPKITLQERKQIDKYITELIEAFNRIKGDPQYDGSNFSDYITDSNGIVKKEIKNVLTKSKNEFKKTLKVLKGNKDDIKRIYPLKPEESNELSEEDKKRYQEFEEFNANLGKHNIAPT